jgi:hypothetical protein
MVDTYVGHGQWKWLAPADAADAYTQGQMSQPSPATADVFNNFSSQFGIAAAVTGIVQLYPLAGLFTGAGLLFSAGAAAVNPTPQQVFNSAADLATSPVPGIRGVVIDTTVKTANPYQ